VDSADSLADDVYTACDSIRSRSKKGEGLAFAYDHGYWIEIIKRGGIEFGDKKVDK